MSTRTYQTNDGPVEVERCEIHENFVIGSTGSVCPTCTEENNAFWNQHYYFKDRDGE